MVVRIFVGMEPGMDARMLVGMVAGLAATIEARIVIDMRDVKLGWNTEWSLVW